MQVDPAKRWDVEHGLWQQRSIGNDWAHVRLGAERVPPRSPGLWALSAEAAGIPSSVARAATSEIANFRPRPVGASGRVSTAKTS